MEESHIIITCPHCNYSRSVPPEKIPEGTVSVNCPKCRGSFPFAPSGQQPSAPPPPESPVLTVSQAPPPVPPPQPDSEPGESAETGRTTRSRPVTPRRLFFNFQGTSGEYFGIWIVNTLLKIVTIGIYSAWAKVRKRRYFYGSTKLDGEQFEYTADPFALFKGWLIGATAFLIYVISERVSLVLSKIAGLVILIAIPWLVVRSRMFNSRNSTYRNIRFAFRPNYSDAYLIFLGLPMLVPFTLGLLIPYVIFRQKKFLVENTSFGKTPFSFHGTPKEFYILFLKVLAGLVMLLIFFFTLVYLFSTAGLIHMGHVAGNRHAFKALIPFFIIFFFLIYFYIATYVRTNLINLTWDRTSIAGCGFRSTLRTLDMLWLYLSNAVAIACSLGLLVPWATVRMARYRFDKLEIDARKEPDEFLALADGEDISATGEEIGDIFGVDVDFGF